MLLCSSNLFMHFKFVPFFLIFFSKFSYLPPSLSFKNVKFSVNLVNQYALKLFFKKGNFLKLKLMVKEFNLNFWLLMGNSATHSTHRHNLLNRNTVTFVNFFSDIIAMFTNFKFIFYFFFSKLNKRLYKFSNYKRPRYSINFKYLPPYRRIKFLLKFMQKSLIHINGKTFADRFNTLLMNFVLKNDNLYFFKYLLKLQKFVFKEQKFMLLTN